MTRIRHLVLCAALGTLPVLAHAQQPPPQASRALPVPARDRAAVTFDEVERGWYVGGQLGFFALTNPPSEDSRPRPFSPGQMAQLEMGRDIGSRLSLGLFVMGASNRAGPEYVGFSQGGAASGDFTTVVPGAVARLRLLGFSDSQGIPRTWLYARAGGGPALFWPKQLLPDSDILVFGGPGVEYYTRLRHFSVGVELTGSYLLSSGSFGFAIAPNLRYAF